jgi:hypothetical protein
MEDGTTDLLGTGWTELTTIGWSLEMSTREKGVGISNSACKAKSPSVRTWSFSRASLPALISSAFFREHIK